MVKNKTKYIVREFSPKNNFQKETILAFKNYDVVLANGKSGTGKTFVSAALALEALERGSVQKIIVSRPVVSVDESIGFLPGTLEQKINPYLMPIMDSFIEFIDLVTLTKMITDGVLEMAALGFLRGRTFNNCFVILDEAQNATVSQITMLLTRLGYNTKCIIQGDCGQSDLNGNNGLKWAMNRLKKCTVVKQLDANNEEVIRSPLVKELNKYLYD